MFNWTNLIFTLVNLNLVELSKLRTKLSIHVTFYHILILLIPTFGSKICLIMLKKTFLKGLALESRVSHMQSPEHGFALA